MKGLQRKALLGILGLFATLVTLLLAFYAKGDWIAYLRDLAARGDTLDLRQLVSPGEPEDALSKVAFLRSSKAFSTPKPWPNLLPLLQKTEVAWIIFQPPPTPSDSSMRANRMRANAAH